MDRHVRQLAIKRLKYTEPGAGPRGYSLVSQGTKALTGTSEKKSRHELEGAPWDRQGEISLTFLMDLRELRARKSRGPGVKKGFIIMSAARTM